MKEDEQSLIMSKAEDLLRNISLYDLIKISMSKEDKQTNMFGVKSPYLEKVSSPQKRELSGFFKEALEL